MKKRVRGIEPPCAAWEAAVLPLNYTREKIFDFRFAIADCNRNKFALQIAVACAVLSASCLCCSAEDSPECFRAIAQPQNVTATKSHRQQRRLPSYRRL